MLNTLPVSISALVPLDGIQTEIFSHCDPTDASYAMQFALEEQMGWYVALDLPNVNEMMRRIIFDSVFFCALRTTPDKLTLSELKKVIERRDQNVKLFLRAIGELDDESLEANDGYLSWCEEVIYAEDAAIQLSLLDLGYEIYF